ncbi:FAD dependent oxidoreductase [Spirosomataceae bacterium TFI 002]|nr:FAD dependent oxidoreductase [Spirosomataceae bacterium TFI 002]
MKIFKNSLFIGLLLFSFSCSDTSKDAEVYKADIIIYGGTSAAVASAVEAKKSGKSVIIVSPDKHLGGLSSGGLGYTDTGNKTVIGGISKEFYQRLYTYYQQPENWKWQKKEEYGTKSQHGNAAIDGELMSTWNFEPHAAEAIFEQYVTENDLEVLRDEWLDRSEGGVTKEGNKILSFKTLSGKTFEGKMFIDVTYEGDLMAAAGVSYHVGREGIDVYGETWNGVQTEVYQHGHQFKFDISPYVIPGDTASGLLAEISDQPPGEKGSGDNKVQAYCFRMCMSNHPDNRIPFPKPANYDPQRYELLGRILDAGWNEVFNKFDMLPNRKTDTNNHGPFSSDHMGANYDYPDASYERRKEIIEEHKTYQQGYLYYLQNDPRVPKEIHDKMQDWGLAADEFVDNENWPHQLYIREARRMIGDFVMTEKDALGKTDIARPIGMGSYSLDAHNAQRYVKEDGFVQNEGDIGVRPERPYSIDFGAILPKEAECSNLLVPVCVSSSHIAFGSIRMEPVFMILGQSAALAASLAIDNGTSPQQVPYDKLRTVLLERKQILEQ